MSLRGNALVGQSGGPTCVINQSLVGVIETAIKDPAINRIFGAVHGIRGVLDENLIDLGLESMATLEAIATTPCAALRSVRHKPTAEDGARVLEVLKKHDIRYFFYIGGNDSAETAHLLNELAVADGYELRLFHVPKTIDNDLCVTDHCPGYGSAAKFVAQAMMGDDQDNRSLPGIKIDVIMGRHAGWLTAASVLARQHEDAGPHLIYVPEETFAVDAFLDDVARMYDKHGRCLVAVSEGIHGPNGETLLGGAERDSHGNVQLSGSGALGDFLANKVKEGLGGRFGSKLRVRADTFGYLQRSFAGVWSEVDAFEAREVGRTAVEIATAGEHPHGSIVIERLSSEPYEVAIGRADLSDVAKVTRDLDPEFRAGTNDIAPAFLDYVGPLVGELPLMGRLSDIHI